MHIVLLSEHGEPLIGGATHLTRKIAESISNKGNKVTFVVPNSNKSINESSKVSESLSIVKVKAVVPIEDRSQFKGYRRKKYSISVSEYLKELQAKDPIDIIQILSGMYLLRYLDVPYFKTKKIKVVAGLLNVPPEECGLSWQGDSILYYYKDAIRKLFIKIINKKRIQFNQFDAYTVESLHVQNSLSKYVPINLIKYIPLGTDESHPRIKERTNLNPKVWNILTAGGINPSKNQHIIPLIARQLIDKGFFISWKIIGPDRNSRYTQFLRKEIEKQGVSKFVHLTLGMPKEKLMEQYENANIYVQTSIEEGFCMTALDAVIYGLPIVGFETGAIAEFIDKSKGLIVGNSSELFCQAIINIIKNSDHYYYGEEKILPVLRFYNWESIGDSYLKLYSRLIS